MERREVSICKSCSGTKVILRMSETGKRVFRPCNDCKGTGIAREIKVLIAIRSFYNATCLKCGALEKKMNMIGVFIMCDKCKKEEFLHFTPIDPNTERGERYCKWLKIYNEMSK